MDWHCIWPAVLGTGQTWASPAGSWMCRGCATKCGAVTGAAGGELAEDGLAEGELPDGEPAVPADAPAAVPARAATIRPDTSVTVPVLRSSTARRMKILQSTAHPGEGEAGG